MKVLVAERDMVVKSASKNLSGTSEGTCLEISRLKAAVTEVYEAARSRRVSDPACDPRGERLREAVSAFVETDAAHRDVRRQLRS